MLIRHLRQLHLVFTRETVARHFDIECVNGHVGFAWCGCQYHGQRGLDRLNRFQKLKVVHDSTGLGAGPRVTVPVPRCVLRHHDDSVAHDLASPGALHGRAAGDKNNIGVEEQDGRWQIRGFGCVKANA